MRVARLAAWQALSCAAAAVQPGESIGRVSARLSGRRFRLLLGRSGFAARHFDLRSLSTAACPVVRNSHRPASFRAQRSSSRPIAAFPPVVFLSVFLSAGGVVDPEAASRPMIPSSVSSAWMQRGCHRPRRHRVLADGDRAQRVEQTDGLVRQLAGLECSVGQLDRRLKRLVQHENRWCFSSADAVPRIMSSPCLVGSPTCTTWNRR